jgi:putative flippase GtrA
MNGTSVLEQLWHNFERLGMTILGMLGVSATTARQIIRFCMVGVFSIGTYVAVMWLMVTVLGVSIVMGSIFAFFIGTSVSYAGNALWSFDARPSPRNATRFVVVTFLGLLLTTAIAWIGQKLNANYLAVSAVVVIVVPTFNFIGHRLVTFGRRRPRG